MQEQSLTAAYPGHTPARQQDCKQSRPDAAAGRQDGTALRVPRRVSLLRLCNALLRTAQQPWKMAVAPPVPPAITSARVPARAKAATSQVDNPRVTQQGPPLHACTRLLPATWQAHGHSARPRWLHAVCTAKHLRWRCRLRTPGVQLHRLPRVALTT